MDTGAEGDARAVDLLLRGGLVVTVNAGRDVIEEGYVAIRSGVIAGVGSERECPFT